MKSHCKIHKIFIDKSCLVFKKNGKVSLSMTNSKTRSPVRSVTRVLWVYRFASCCPVSRSARKSLSVYVIQLNVTFNIIWVGSWWCLLVADMVLPHLNTISQAHSIPTGHILQLTSGKLSLLPWSNLWMLSAWQGSIKYRFLSIWYDLAGNWTHDPPHTTRGLYHWSTGCSVGSP